MRKKYIIPSLISSLLLILVFICLFTMFENTSFEKYNDEVEIESEISPLSSNIDSESDESSPSSFDSIYKSQDESKITLESIAMLYSYDCQENDLVSTEGFYFANDGGGAMYKIVIPTNPANNMTLFDLKNGLQAELVVNNDTIYIDQLGAHGDSLSDDSSILNWAFNQSDCNIVFSEKKYVCNNSLVIASNNINVFGNNASIATSDDYIGANEWFIKIAGSGINIHNLNILSLDTILVPYKTQVGIVKGTDICIENCHFLIPETIYKNDTKPYTNLDLYSGWENITIKNCIIENYASTYGGNIWIRDIWNLGCVGALIENNVIKKNTHDEVIAVFNGSIQDVKIFKNDIVATEANLDNPSNLCFKFGSEKSQICDNIQFENNTVSCSSTNFIAKVGNCTNLSINNNNITFTKLGTKALWLFDISGSSQPSNVSICDNVFDISSPVDISRVFNLPGFFSNNTITVNNISVKNVYKDSNSINGGNNVLIKNGIKSVLK